MRKRQKQSGSALYFTILITGILLTLAVISTSIFVRQLRAIEDAGESVIALSAADAGIEKILDNWGNEDFFTNEDNWNERHYFKDGDEDISYILRKTDITTAKDQQKVLEIRSIGNYRETKRAILITRRTEF